MRRYQEAIEWYSKAITLDPTVAVYYGNRSIAHLKLENYGFALRDASATLEIDHTYIKVFSIDLSLAHTHSHTHTHTHTHSHSFIHTHTHTHTLCRGTTEERVPIWLLENSKRHLLTLKPLRKCVNNIEKNHLHILLHSHPHS